MERHLFTKRDQILFQKVIKLEQRWPSLAFDPNMIHKNESFCYGKWAFLEKCLRYIPLLSSKNKSRKKYSNKICDYDSDMIYWKSGSLTPVFSSTFSEESWQNVSKQERGNTRPSVLTSINHNGGMGNSIFEKKYPWFNILLIL